ncbi:MAG: Holo-[acyl-carrier-protein] synthase [Ignavibacteria bacterium]|nr:Holo-[acyl-carrier-protein] synthase [Ignavibacteria bacterium]
MEGIGIDIIEIKRINKLIEDYGERFFQRILTENEINYCKKFSKPELHFAGRFASKEAYSKAIGTGIGKNFGWKDIEILNNEKGKPYIVHLKENEFSNYSYQISISHTEDYACAVVSCSKKSDLSG